MRCPLRHCQFDVVLTISARNWVKDGVNKYTVSGCVAGVQTLESSVFWEVSHNLSSRFCHFIGIELKLIMVSSKCEFG